MPRNVPREVAQDPAASAAADLAQALRDTTATLPVLTLPSLAPFKAALQVCAGKADTLARGLGGRQGRRP